MNLLSIRPVSKSAQVTSYIILAMLAGLAILFVLTATDLVSRTQPLHQSDVAFTAYVEQCVRQSIQNSTHQYVQTNLASFRDQVRYLQIQNNSIPFAFTYATGHTPPFVDDVQKSLALQVQHDLLSCLQNVDFSHQGIYVNDAQVQLQTSVKLHPQLIEVTIDYPVRVEKNDQQFSHESMKFAFSHSLGTFLLLESDIVNAQVTNKFVDTLKFSTPDLIVFVHQIYPHSYYTLQLKSENISYSFAIESESNFASQTFGLNPMYVTGPSCTVNNYCYEQIASSLCQQKSGSIQSTMCENNLKISYRHDALASCNTIPSGESWCAPHENTVGLPELLNFCLDGVIYTQPCRDYRQEVCVEKDGHAQCRQNTALLCATCQNQSCCEQFDCEFSDGVCLPKVSLGLPVWQVQADTLCQNFLQRYPSNLTVRLQAKICGQTADCIPVGLGLNLPNNEQLDASFSPEMLPVDDNQRTDGKNGQINQRSSNELSYNAVNLASISTLGNTYAQLTSQTSLTKEFYQVINQLDNFSRINKTLALNKAVLPADYITCRADTERNQVGSHMQQSLNCSDCHRLYANACSEYVCRSMSALCEFHLPTQVCRQVNKSRMSDAQGFLIPPLIVNISHAESVVNDTLRVELTTTSESLCRPWFLPNAEWSDVTTTDLSYGIFAKNHTFVLRFINDLPVFDNLAESYNVESYNQVLDKLQSFIASVNAVTLSKYNSQVNHPVYSLIEKVLYANQMEGPRVQQLLQNLENKNMTVFFYCKDEWEQTTQSNHSFRLERACSTPIIQNLTADFGSVVKKDVMFSTSTFAQCRFAFENKSFDEMTHNALCPVSAYDTTNGYYECVASNVSGLYESFSGSSQENTYPVYISCLATNTAQTHKVQIIYDPTNESALNVSLQKPIKINSSMSFTTRSNQFALQIGFRGFCVLANRNKDNSGTDTNDFSNGDNSSDTSQPVSLACQRGLCKIDFAPITENDTVLPSPENNNANGLSNTQLASATKQIEAEIYCFEQSDVCAEFDQKHMEFGTSFLAQTIPLFRLDLQIFDDVLVNGKTARLISGLNMTRCLYKNEKTAQEFFFNQSYDFTQYDKLSEMICEDEFGQRQSIRVPARK